MLGLALLGANDAQAEPSSGVGSAGARGARWQKSTVNVNVEHSVNLLGDRAFDGLVGAVSAWQAVPAELPTIVVTPAPEDEEDEIGFRRGGNNKNTVRYSPQGDPLANGALAITVITFDANAREILDADIILNGEHRFAIFEDGADREQMQGAVYDLQNVLTHELGHLLGLGEDYEDERATMYAYSQPGETIKRDLEPIDVDSVTQLYLEPFGEPSSGGCGGATIAAKSSETWLFGAFGLLAVVAVMRRRSARAVASGVSAFGALAIVLTTSSPLPPVDGLLAADTTLSAATPSVVTRAASRWDGNLIVTTLTLRPEGAATGADEITVDTLGGRVGDLVQQVGHVRPPRVGDVIALRFDAPGSGAEQRLFLKPGAGSTTR